MQQHEPELNPEAEPKAPPKLVAALKDLHNQRIFVPSQIDEAVLSRAREQLPQARPEQPRWGALPRWAALAACGAILLGLSIMQFNRGRQEPTIVYAREDINRDGSVDVLDALALSTQIQNGASGSPDINGDGLVDQRDAAAIAQQIVRLEKGGRS